MTVRKKKKTAVKANTALVVNPRRQLTIGRKKTMATRKKKPAARRAAAKPKRRRNPSVTRRTTKAPVRKYRRRTAKRNPATVSGLLGAAAVAGVGVTVFDKAVETLAPNLSPVMKAGVKLGGAYLAQGKYGKSIPFFGSYHREIALALAVLGFVDLSKIYLIPLLSDTAANFKGLLGGIGQPAAPVPAVAAGEELSGFRY